MTMKMQRKKNNNDGDDEEERRKTSGVVAVVSEGGLRGKGKVRERRRASGMMADAREARRGNGHATAMSPSDDDKTRTTHTPVRLKQQPALRLDMLPHSDLEGGEKGDDPPRRFPDDVLFTHVDAKCADGDGQYSDKVLRINFDSPVGAQDGMRIVRKGKVPVVMRRTPFLTSLVAKWDFNHMVRSYDVCMLPLCVRVCVCVTCAVYESIVQTSDIGSNLRMCVNSRAQTLLVLLLLLLLLQVPRLPREDQRVSRHVRRQGQRQIHCDQ